MGNAHYLPLPLPAGVEPFADDFRAQPVGGGLQRGDVVAGVQLSSSSADSGRPGPRGRKQWFALLPGSLHCISPEGPIAEMAVARVGGRLLG
jgi:hypothetical protein